jgi:hypothetical protein
MESNSHYQPGNLRLHQHSDAPRHRAINSNFHPRIPQDYPTSQHASQSDILHISPLSLTDFQVRSGSYGPGIRKLHNRTL